MTENKQTPYPTVFPGGAPPYPPPQPAGGFQQPVGSPAEYAGAYPGSVPYTGAQYPGGVPYYPPPPHQAIPVAGVAAPYRAEEPLICVIGLGWILFILGFFFTIPWYIGAAMLLCLTDKREKPGSIACAIAAAICTILIIIIVAVQRSQ